VPPLQPQLLRRLAPLLVALAAAAPARGQLYVMSQQSQEVLAYDASDGSFQSVFAATVSEGFRVPAGISLRPSDGVLYVSSVSTGELWSYTTATGEPISPAVSSEPLAPGGIDFDASGSFLYFADANTIDSENRDAVKRLDVGSGVVTTVGTNNQADLLGVAVNGSFVFATDLAQSRILRFPVTGGNATSVVSAGLAAPAALLFPTASQMLVADSGNDRVVEYLESGGSWSFSREVLPASAGVADPGGLALAPDGRLTICGRQSGDVVLVDLATLAVTPWVAPGAGGLTDPADVAWSGNSLLVASPSGNAVFYFDASGQPTGVRAEGLSAVLDSGIHLSADGSRLYIASGSADDVLEYHVASGARLRTFNSVCPNLPFPFDIATGADDRLYVSCLLNSSIERFDLITGSSLGSFVLAGTGGLVSPRGLAFGENGNLFVANGTGAVLQFDGVSGAPVAPTPFVDTNGNGGGPLDAYAFAFRNGVLYVASLLYDEVMTFDATDGSYISTFVSACSGGLDGPRSLAFGPDGDLYVASMNDDRVLRYDGSTGIFVETFVTAGSGGLDGPIDVVFGSAAATPVPASQPGARLALCGLLLVAAAISARGVRGAREEKT